MKPKPDSECEGGFASGVLVSSGSCLLPATPLDSGQFSLLSWHWSLGTSGQYLALALEGVVSRLQLNLCFCWKLLSHLSTTLTKFIFHGLGLRGVPRARLGNEH